MQRKAIFNNKLLPYLLLAPQLAITFVFFFWPAGEAVWYSFIRQDAFGISKQFVWFENFTDLFADPLYHQVIINTLIFSVAVTALAMGLALGLAVVLTVGSWLLFVVGLELRIPIMPSKI